MQTQKPSLYNPDRFEKASLNRQVRKKELMRITVENQAILRRLQDKAPTYSVTKWEQDFKVMEKLKENMMEQPEGIGIGNTRSRALLTTANLDPSDPAYNSIPRPPQSAYGSRPRAGPGGFGNMSNYGSANARGQSAHTRMGPSGSLPLI